MSLFNEPGRIKSITISVQNLADILAGKTNNPIAEEEIPTLLKNWIESGIKVYIADEFAHTNDRKRLLEISKGGGFTTRME